MSVQLPARPQKGQVIPHDYFQRMWDHQKSLELRGDLKTTTVKRDHSGTVVRAPNNGGNNSTIRAHAYIGKITADNNDGTYDAKEQANAAGTFSDGLPANALSLGSATNDNGFLYELNGFRGVPVGTFVVVHRVADTGGGPIWYFDGQQSAYGVDGPGAWAEITAESSGAYSWKQKDPDGTTDSSPSVTGSSDAYEINGAEGVAIGTKVWLRYDKANDDYRFDYKLSPFMAEITGESAGSYSWTEQTAGKAAGTTARTGSTNATEVNGRTGIPTGSFVLMRPRLDDGAAFDFEFHGADSGTLDTLNAGTGATAQTDTWARDNQGSTRGEDHPYVARVRVDSTSGEMRMFTRVQEHDANGHEDAISAETMTVLGVLTPSDETYEYVDCATGLTTVARFAFADKPADYCWVHDGSDFVKSYNDGISAGAATSPAPCAVEMASAPANCAATTFAAFDDDFDDSSLDTCRWSKTETGSGTVTEGSTIDFDSPVSGGNSESIINSECPVGSSNFSFKVTYSSLSLIGTVTDSAQFFIDLTVGGTQIQVGGSDGGGDTDAEYTYVGDGTGAQTYGTIATSGTLEVVRTGTSLALNINGSTVKTVTISGSVTVLRFFCFSNAAADASVTLTKAEFTGG
jgi:hypothetical protein